MKKRFTIMIAAIIMLLTMLTLPGKVVGQTTYTFNTASWGTTTTNWTCGSAGDAYVTQGVRVTTGKTGANATSPTSFTNISKIEVVYSGNSSKGKGTIKIKIGSNT